MSDEGIGDILFYLGLFFGVPFLWACRLHIVERKKIAVRERERILVTPVEELADEIAE